MGGGFGKADGKRCAPSQKQAKAITTKTAVSAGKSQVKPQAVPKVKPNHTQGQIKSVAKKAGQAPLSTTQPKSKTASKSNSLSRMEAKSLTVRFNEKCDIISLKGENEIARNVFERYYSNDTKANEKENNKTK